MLLVLPRSRRVVIWHTDCCYGLRRIFMKRTEARIKQDVLEDSMNTRRTLRKAVAGLLKQTVATAPAPSASSNHGNTEFTESTEDKNKK
jgi:hypothetical protein